MLFSIITCTYNSEKYLSKNIASIKSQSFQNYEHIFIDGQSTDNTMNILNKYQKSSPDNIHIYQYPPKGISNAMNKGIIKAKGKYIIHLHADDYLHSKNILHSVSVFLERNNYPDWIYGKAIFKNLKTHKSKIIPYRKIYTKVYKNLLLLTNYIPHQSVFIKSDTFKKYGYFREDLKNSMDYEYWIRISNITKSVFYPKIICNYSIHENSQSEKFKKNQIKEDKLIRNLYVKNYVLKLILDTVSFFNSKRKLV